MKMNQNLHQTRYFVVITMGFLFSCGFGPKKAKTSKLFPYESIESGFLRSKTTYGYIDLDGNKVIKPSFKDAKPFTEGLGCVANDSQHYGYIDSTGNYVIQPIYMYAGCFNEGRALVSMDLQNYGYIDRTGNWVTPFIFSRYASDFYRGTAIAYVYDRTDSGNSFGDVIAEIFTLGFADTDYEVYRCYRVDHNGDTLLIDPATVRRNHDDYWELQSQNSLVKFHDERSNKYGYKKITLQEFGMISRESGNKYDNDTIGTVVISPEYYHCDNFRYGYAKVYLENGKRGYIDTTGKVLVTYAPGKK